MNGTRDSLQAVMRQLPFASKSNSEPATRLHLP
jgi:hypothetical protein